MEPTGRLKKSRSVLFFSPPDPHKQDKYQQNPNQSDDAPPKQGKNLGKSPNGRQKSRAAHIPALVSPTARKDQTRPKTSGNS